ncbi:CHAT domain-containing protein [Sorangium sp. So ce429]
MRTLVITIREDQADPSSCAVDLRLDGGAMADGPCAERASGRLPRNPPAAVLGLPATKAEQEAMGQALFQLLAESGIGDTWRRLRKRYPREQPPGSEGLRTVLDVQVGELRSLAWELMQDASRRLFADASNPAVLGALDAGPDGELADWPLRVLIIVGCEAEDGVVRWRDELRDVKRALDEMRDDIDYEVLHRPSVAALADTHRAFKPHVIHFIGHGTEEIGTGRPALEIWDDQAESAWSWSAPEIVSTLSAWAPRLVIANACRSGDRGEAGAFALADAFLEAGAVAFLGMRGDIQGEAAALLAARLYRSFVEGRSLDQSLSDARLAVLTTPSITAAWWRPRLVLSVPPERVLRIASPIPAQERLRIQRAGDFTPVSDFVNRRRERRQLLQRIDAATTGTRHVQVVSGGDDTGKTALLLWCLKACALRRQRVRYVDLDGPVTKNFLAVLRAIRGGDEPAHSPVRSPLPEPAFRRFHFDLQHLLAGREPPEPEGPLLAPVPDASDRQLPPGDERAIPRIFTAFRAALADAAGGEPLLVVLDHLKGVFPPHFKQYMTRHLLDPIAQGAVPNVRVLIAASDGEYSEYGLAAVVPAGEVLQVSPFGPDEFVELAEEFCRHNSLKCPSKIINAVAESIQSAWRPEMLRVMQTLVRTLPASGG